MTKKSIVLELGLDTLNTISDAVGAHGLTIEYTPNGDGHPIRMRVQPANCQAQAEQPHAQQRRPMSVCEALRTLQSLQVEGLLSGVSTAGLESLPCVQGLHVREASLEARD